MPPLSSPAYVRLIEYCAIGHHTRVSLFEGFRTPSTMGLCSVGAESLLIALTQGMASGGAVHNATHQEFFVPD